MPSSSAATKPQKPRILVVDDEAVNRLLLSRILRANAEIVEAADGMQALDRLAAGTFDLVLLDIMMPRMDGFQVLKAIRSTPETTDLPVILISALTENDNIVRGLQLEANDYITKPIDIDVVLARVDTQLKLKTTMDLQKRAISELQAAQNMKDRLFRIASHDLRAPLANMRLVQTLLRDYIADQPEALEILEMLNVTVDKMRSIVEDFLDMAAFQGGNIEIRMQSVPVAPIVNAVVAQYSMTAFKKNIALVTDDLPGIVQADPPKLEQVLNNLVSNALKYSPSDTTVTITSAQHDDRVRIMIADQGPGIPEDERDRLFKEFSKLSTRPTGNEASSGLGLWIVKQIITLQGGTVGVDNPPEGGSIFWVELASGESSSSPS